MQIGITSPLRTFLRWKTFSPNAEDLPLFCWDAHRTKMDDRVMLVVCNAANRFAGITAMRGSDWKHLDEVCRDLIAASMCECGFFQSAVEEYLARAGDIEFGRTHGRSAVGCMNRLIDTVSWVRCERDEQFQAGLTAYANLSYIGSSAEHAGYGRAADWMAEDLLGVGIYP